MDDAHLRHRGRNRPVLNRTDRVLLDRSLRGVSKMSRDKGKRGELEVVALANGSGLSARRTAPLQAAGQLDPALNVGDVLIIQFPLLHIEVKRDERMSVDAMCRQAEAEAPEGHKPVVAYRRNNRPWSAVVPLSHYLELLGVSAAVRELMTEREKSHG